MKKIFTYGILLIFQISIILSAQGQNRFFYGTAYDGGLNNDGVIFKTDNIGNNYTVVHNFNVDNGKRPGYGNLCHINGTLYGTTEDGGLNNLGVLFSYNIVTQTYTKLHDFDGESTGDTPKSHVIQAQNGKLYGTTFSGGLYDSGTLFEFDIESGVLAKKVDFDNLNSGTQVFANVMQASNGKLYGVTNKGGLNNSGTLYEYDYTTEIFSKLIDFSSSTFGVGPSVLVEINNDVLYGTCWSGGDFSGGTIFEYTISTNTVIKKFNFDRLVTGSNSVFSLMKASNGKLYGLTRWGTGTSTLGGVLFEYDVTTEAFALKQSFGVDIGDFSSSPLLEVNGYLYGLSSKGGLNNKGTLLEYNINTNQLINKYDFEVANGSGPRGGFIEIDESALSTYEINLKVREVNIFPNPVIDNLIISSKNTEVFQIAIFNVLGSQVFHKPYVVNNEQLKVGHLQSGIYVLKATSKSGNTKTLKFIKN